MDRNIKRILFLTAILILAAIIYSSVYAVTLKETTNTSDNYDTIEKGSYIIGSTKFTPDTVITGAVAAQAGANDMKLYIAKNGTAEGYEYPKVLYYNTFGKWKEYTSNGELKDANLNTTSFEIYYVDNVEKAGKDTATNDEIELPTIEKNEFAYSFINETTVVKVGTALEGEEITVPAAPTKDHYTFKGWYYLKNNELGNKVEPNSKIAITEDTVIVAIWEINKYTVRFLAEDGETVLMSHEFEYGTNLFVALNTDEEFIEKYYEMLWNLPVKEGTEEYDYEFTGWDGEFDEDDPIIKGDMTFRAKYEKAYYIQFLNDDGEGMLWSGYVIEGELPEYIEYPERYGTPTKPATMAKQYTFNGWDHEVVPAVAHATYTAVFEEEDRLYTVIFNNYDGNELENKQLTYNADITYTGEEPTKEMTDDYIYVFAGWSPTIENTKVSYDNMVFVAQYNEIPRVYNVDLSEVIPTKSETFRETYYNKYNTTYSTADGEEITGETATFDDEMFDFDVFYVEIGDYPLAEVPEEININDSVYYGDENKNISIGYNSFLYAPVYTVENGKLYVALTWLIAESLPGNNNVITLGDLTYNVQTLAAPADENDVLTIKEVLTSNRANNVVTVDGNTIIQDTDSWKDLILIVLAKGEQELNDIGEIFYRLDSNGNMGFTLSESLSGTYKKVISEGTVANPVFTYGAYISYGALPANTITRNYKIANTQYGAINIILKMIGSNSTTRYVNSAQTLEAALTNENVNSIIQVKDIDFTGLYSAYAYHVLNFGDPTSASENEYTLDLNGHTIISKNAGVIYQGNNVTMKNGTFQAPEGNTYAMFIGDEEETNNYCIKDVTIDGGINVYNAHNIVLDNVTLTSHEFYAIWGDENSQITINSGTYSASEDATALFAMVKMDGTDHVTDVNENGYFKIYGGTFNTNGKSFCSDNVIGELQQYVLPEIYGGQFDCDVSNYVADGYVCNFDEITGYWVVTEEPV